MRCKDKDIKNFLNELNEAISTVVEELADSPPTVSFQLGFLLGRIESIKAHYFNQDEDDE